MCVISFRDPSRLPYALAPEHGHSARRRRSRHRQILCTRQSGRLGSSSILLLHVVRVSVGVALRQEPFGLAHPRRYLVPGTPHPARCRPASASTRRRSECRVIIAGCRRGCATDSGTVGADADPLLLVVRVAPASRSLLLALLLLLRVDKRSVPRGAACMREGVVASSLLTLAAGMPSRRLCTAGCWYSFLPLLAVALTAAHLPAEASEARALALLERFFGCVRQEVVAILPQPLHRRHLFRLLAELQGHFSCPSASLLHCCTNIAGISA